MAVPIAAVMIAPGSIGVMPGSVMLVQRGSRRAGTRHAAVSRAHGAERQQREHEHRRYTTVRG